MSVPKAASIEELEAKRREMQRTLLDVDMPADTTKPDYFRAEELSQNEGTCIRVSYHAKDEVTGRYFRCTVGYVNGAFWSSHNTQTALVGRCDTTLKQGRVYADLFAKKLTERVAEKKDIVREIHELDRAINRAVDAERPPESWEPFVDVDGHLE